MREHPGEAISALIDGTLDAAGTAEVEAHLRTCASCRHEADALRATMGDLRALGRPALSEMDRARLHAELGKARRTSGTPWNRIGAVAAALVLVIGGGVMLTRGGDDDRTLAGGPAVVTEENYTEENVRDLLTDAPQELKAESAASAPADQGVDGAGASVLADGPIPIPDIDHEAQIAECESTFLADEEITRVKRLVARYEGEPAYFLTYEMPKGQPTHRELWVLAVEDCTIRYFAEQKL
jgi:hypothetical protein